MTTLSDIQPGLKLSDVMSGRQATSTSHMPIQPQRQLSLGERLRNLVFVPKGQEDKTAGFGGVVDALESVPSEIGKAAARSGEQFKADLFPKDAKQASESAGMFGPGVNLLMDAAGVALSPIVGSATSLVGRPVEAATGVRRELTGNLVSAFIPLGGEATAAKDAKSAAALAETLKPVAGEAHSVGYVLPPQMMSKQPGTYAKVLSGWGGKIKTQQEASVRNQEITNKLVKQDLGIPEDTHLTEEVFSDLRKKAGAAYAKIKDAIPAVVSDIQYEAKVKSLGGANSQAAQYFPNITKNQDILDLSKELQEVTTFPTPAGVELVKELRSRATASLKAIGDPSKHALGLAQREAADAVDDLMERNIALSGQQDLINEYKKARTLIAKSYDVEGATNAATGNVNARGLAKLAAKGRPFTGNLDTVARVASAFPKAVQSEELFGGTEAYSMFDFFGSAYAMAHGNTAKSYEMLGAIMSRPLARKAVLGTRMQDRLAGAGGIGATAKNVMRRAPALYAGGSTARDVADQLNLQK